MLPDAELLAQRQARRTEPRRCARGLSVHALLREMVTACAPIVHVHVPPPAAPGEQITTYTRDPKTGEIASSRTVRK